jgi:hypothetical protein
MLTINVTAKAAQTVLAKLALIPNSPQVYQDKQGDYYIPTRASNRLMGSFTHWLLLTASGDLVILDKDDEGVEVLLHDYAPYVPVSLTLEAK